MTKRTFTVILLLAASASCWAFGSREKKASTDEILPPSESRNRQANLLAMAESGDIKGVEKLLKVDVNLDKTDGEGRTALHAAVENRYEQIAAILLASGADPNAQDDSGRRPLHAAVKNNDPSMARVLVKAGADISLTDDSGTSPVSKALDLPAGLLAALLTPGNINTAVINDEPLLHITARNGQKDHLTTLLEAGANPSILNNAGQRPIDAALESQPDVKQIECAALLLQKGSENPLDTQWDYIEAALKDNGNTHRFNYGATALHMAAERGHEGVVEYLLEKGADPLEKDNPGNTPLHVAVRKGYQSIAGMLLKNGAEINIPDYNGNTPLHESLTAAGQSRLTAMLLEKGADPNMKNSAGLSPLHICVLMGADVSAAQLLVDYGAQSDSRDRNGNTPLFLAVDTGEKELTDFFTAQNANIFARNKQGETPVERILSYGAEVTRIFFDSEKIRRTDNEGRSSLHIAAGNGTDTDTIQALLESSAPVNMRDAFGNTPLHYAVSGSHFPQAAVLLANGADAYMENNNGESPLILAFREGGESVLMLLQENIDTPDASGRSPLFLAASWNYPDIVSVLLQNSASPGTKNYEGETPLHAAVQAGNREIAEMLLNAGASVNTADNNGLTALHNSVLWEKESLAELLIAAGADCSKRDNRGRTPLHLAVEGGNNELTVLFLNAGADIDTSDINGRTALFAAADSGNREAIDLLLKAGASLDTRDSKGRTLLHTALAAGEGEIASVLLESGSDFFALDAAGQTPADIAIARGTRFLESFVTAPITRRQDNRGNTLLHIAVMNGAGQDVIKLLLNKGADPYRRNAQGETPGALAGKAGREEIASLLM
ncbi:MAG: hypothetical protein CSA76_02485 [Spirochaetales bacterium]|nr:MAG: hypothetical protein CSA76_02485 [Spirochaetales bacterium]